jgi:uracil-DNA glycosylase
VNISKYLTEKSWKKYLDDQFELDYFKNLILFLEQENKNHTIYPDLKYIFSALNLTPFQQTKIVIIGQDPYHGYKQANGLCFSVKDGIKKPPSLLNIFKEIKSDLSIKTPESGNLEYLAKQGVLLLNTSLTVRAQNANSHQNIGWEKFTTHVIKTISEKKQNVIFLLWGNFAQKKEELIDQKKHFILKASHPSPFSAYRGFFGCKHFSKSNEILIKTKQKPIEWVKY